MYTNMRTLSILLLCAPAFSFAPPARTQRAPAAVSSTALQVSMVSSFLREPKYNDSSGASADKRQHHSKKNQPNRMRNQPKTYQLHSNRVSELTVSSTAEDVMTAIKRARNLHDAHDIQVIGRFLLQEVDDSFAYGYKESLLARFSVAALRLREDSLARKAIQVRETRFASSILPFESAAIVRALNRANKVDEAFRLVEEELPLPSSNNKQDFSDEKEILKHRALSLASIASHSFFKDHPAHAVKACQMLSEMGPKVQSVGLYGDELNIPWTRILAGAKQCKSKGAGKKYFAKVVHHAMKAFSYKDKDSEVDSVVSIYS